MVWYDIDFSRLRAFISLIKFYTHTQPIISQRVRERILVSKIFLFCYFCGNYEEDKRFMLMTPIRKRLLVVWLDCALA
jgi:hypothetical protein